ncbi:hypothetical protein IEU95_01720 [Hoyosella rhizosphaerae]|uniref:DUF8175 domain-containing protein n=1 Tax=Hoyosella rhizosphaerae TaxID=1755582 RepID=A0A916UEM6_9ACTN|nr:hypothetical protein [Hoyosella rhizosphaerae]MBN4925533.1 hypothetical protein [Hoyosella rhizosphaerae]GGC69889.1 hypothetical protein GCM10011410_23420 [Hoyosella rhizosphaerae]
MTEQAQGTQPDENHIGTSSLASTRVGAVVALVTMIVVMGAAVSIWILIKGDDQPLASSDLAPSAAQQQRPASKFEPDPWVDVLGRAVYVPLDERGVILDQYPPATNRTELDAPGGVVLQQIHGNMAMPFSATDGPTGFTDNGIAKGFARTAQGAGLAGAHYMGYLAGGNDRIALMQEAGLVIEESELLQEDIRHNASGGELAARNSRPQGTAELIKVDYHNGDLAQVRGAHYLEAPNGETWWVKAWVQVVWRDGLGWVVKISGVDTFGSGWFDQLEGTGWGAWWS